MLIKLIVVAAAAIGTTITVVVIHDKPAPLPAPAVLRPATPAERQLLESLSTVAPKPQGGMH